MKKTKLVEATISRRAVLKQAAVASLLGGVQGSAVWAGAATPLSQQHVRQIKGLVRREDTIVRPPEVVCAGGFPMTWAADGRVFVIFADTTGLAPGRKAFHSRAFTMLGEPPHLTFEDVPGYPDMPMRMRESDFASFWGGSCLSVDGRVYHFLSTPNHPYLKPDGSFWPDFYMLGAKLIYSPDNGLTWHNQDGSYPVVWENWNARSRKNMVFFNEEPERAFTQLCFLQMGRNYELNTDGYVYVYSLNGDTEPTANELVLFRVPKSRILDRNSYQYFSGLGPDGGAAWVSDITARSAAHVFPRGWVSGKVPGELPVGWSISVVYNAPLGVYMMVGQGTGRGPDGGWFGKPSYLGFWVAPTPWGPFTQIHEDLAWTPGNDRAARVFAPQIVPKWISADGKSFWLVWSDYQYKGTQGEVENPDKGFVHDAKSITDDAEYARALESWVRGHAPNHGFNMQRVDLLVE